MALALSQSQSGTTTSYMSTSASPSYWTDADASTAAFSYSAGVPGGSASSNAMPYNTVPHAGVGANSSSLYSVHHQGINPTAHHSYGGYSDHGGSQGHPTSYHNPSHTQSHLSQAQVQRPGPGMTGGMRRSPTTSSSSSPGGSSSSSLQYALRPHGHSHHSPLSAALASTTGSSGSGGVSSPSAFSPPSGSSGSSGSSSLVSSLALSSLSNSNANANSNSNSSVSPISPQHPHAHHHFHHGHSQTHPQHQQHQQQFQNNHGRNQNQTSYVHSHAYPPVSGSGAAAVSGSVVSGSAAYHQIPSTSNNTSNHVGHTAAVTANPDIHGGLYTFDSPEPSNPPAFESDLGPSGSPPSGAYKAAHSHSHSHAHAYPRLQIPTGALQSGYGHGYGHGYSHTPVSPHVQTRSPSAYAHAVNGYGNDTPVSEVPPGSYITRDRSGSIRARGRASARVKTEPDLLEESRSLERSPDLSHGVATPSNEGGGGGGGGGDGGEGARFVMEHPYPYIYATRDDGRDQSPRSFSPPSPSSLTPGKNGPPGHSDYSSSSLNPDREQKHDAQQVQATPHTLTAPLRAVNASAEMRQCMGVFRLDPFAQLNGVALRCGFVSSFDEAGFSGKKSSNKSKNKSKGKKGGKSAKKRGSGRKKTRKNAAGRALESDDEDTVLGSDITDEERGEGDEGEDEDDNTPTWDGLPAGPLAKEPVLIEFQLYFDGMEVDEGEDECGVGDDAEDMKVLDADMKWEEQGRGEDIDEGNFATFDNSNSPGARKYGRSRAYSYSAAAVAEAAARDKGITTTTNARRYRVVDDAHRGRYSDGTEYTNNNASSSFSPRRGPEYERESESYDRKPQLASRSHHATQSQSRAAPPTPRAMATSRTLGMFEEYLSLDLGSMDDINMDMAEMDGWGSGGTSPSTPYALTQGDSAGGANPFTTSFAQAQRTGGSNSTSTRPTIITSASPANNNTINSSADLGGASSSLHPNTNLDSFSSVSVSSSSPVLPSSSSSPYSNEFTDGGLVRARYIDSAGYMRFSDSTQIPSSASASAHPTSNSSSSPSPFYGLTTGAASAGAMTSNVADDTATLQQLRTQAALRAVSAHAAAQTQSQGLHAHGLYRGSSESGSAANAPHRLAGAPGSGHGVSGGGVSAAGAMGAGPVPVNFTPTPASIAAEMQTGLLTGGRLGAAKPPFGQGQGQAGSAYHAYSQTQTQTHSMSSESPSATIPPASSSPSNSGYSAYPDYSSGLPDSSSMSEAFGQNHGHEHNHDHNHGHGHGGNQSIQALERRWSDVLQRVHG
ncbi:hypothetical protein ACEPAF_1485 [Sanghuangporus sanghuang]